MRKINGMVQLFLALSFGSANAVMAAVHVWTGAADGWWTTGANWNPNQTNLAGHTLMWDASSTANRISTNNYANLSVTSFNFTNAPDGVVLNGSNLTLTSTQPFLNPSLTVGKATVNLNLALVAAVTNSFENNYNIAINGVLSGPGSSITTKRGVYILNGANTFSGNAILGSGGDAGVHFINTLTNSGVAQSLGTGSLVQFGNGASGKANVTYTGKATSTDKSFQIGGSGVDGSSGGFFANGSGPVIWMGNQILATTANARVFTLGGINTDENTWQGSISNNNTGAVNLTKEGAGKWVLSGNNGFTNGITLNSGTLVLDYGVVPTVIDSSNKPIFAGGTLEIRGKSSGTTVQSLGNVTINAGGMSGIKLNKNGGSGVALTFGTLSPSTGGGNALLFDLGGDGANSITVGTGLPLSSYRLLVKDASGRVDFAKTNAASAVEAIASTANYTATPSSSQYQLTNSLVLTGSGKANTVRINPGADGQSLTLQQTNPETNSSITAVLFVGSRDFTITQSVGQNGAFGSLTTSNSAALIYHYGTGKLTLDTKLAGDNSIDGYGSGIVDFMGTGLIDWTRPANSSNVCTIAGVILRQSGANGQSLNNTLISGRRSGCIVLTSGGVLEISDATTLTRDVGTGAGALRWAGDGGFSAYGGNRSVNLGGGNSTMFTWGATSFIPANNALVLCSAYATHTIDFQNPVHLGSQQRLVRVNNGSATIDAKLSGVLSSDLNGGLVKEGEGTLELTATNTYNGATWIKTGGLRVSGTTGTGIPGTPEGGLVTVFNGASISGTGRVDRLTLNAGGKLVPYDTGSGVPSKLHVTGAFDISAGTLDLSLLTGPLADGDLVIAECGSIIGTAFANTITGTVTRDVVVVGNTIVLKGGGKGFLLMVK